MKCLARHPTYKKVFCQKLEGHDIGHWGQLPKGYWVGWLDPANIRPSFLAALPDKNCWYCGISFANMRFTRDHVIPRSKGGKDKNSNIVLACQPCNNEKSDMLLEDYREFLAKRGKGVIMFWGEQDANAK